MDFCGYPATKAARLEHYFNIYRQEGLKLAETNDTNQRETGSTFLPKFDDRGLLSAIVQDSQTGEILMFAFMNEEAIAKTRETGFAHFYSRSRDRLWKKGETSGNVLEVNEVRVDCDQDAIVLSVRPAGPACHTGERSCFYRVMDGDGLKPID